MAKDISKKEENEIKKDIVKELKEKVLIEVNKEIKNAILDNTESFKNDLKEEFNSSINSEVSSLIKKEEKKLVRSKNFKILKLDVVIIILLVISLYFGYCLYDAKYFDFMKSECEKNGTCTTEVVNNDDTTKEDVVIKDKDWYIENYGYLLNSAQIDMNNEDVRSYYLYSGDHKLKNIKVSYLLNLAYKNMDSKKVKTNSLKLTVKEEDLQASFEDLFGSTDLYKAASFTYDCLNFTYNEDKKTYTAENNKCSNSNKNILEKITDMFEDSNKIYIITSATLFDSNEDAFYRFDDFYEPAVLNVTEEDFLDNLGKLNSYQYIFKQSGDKYYLESITKLK